MRETGRVGVAAQYLEDSRAVCKRGLRGEKVLRCPALMRAFSEEEAGSNAEQASRSHSTGNCRVAAQASRSHVATNASATASAITASRSVAMGTAKQRLCHHSRTTARSPPACCAFHIEAILCASAAAALSASHVESSDTLSRSRHDRGREDLIICKLSPGPASLGVFVCMPLLGRPSAGTTDGSAERRA